MLDVLAVLKIDNIEQYKELVMLLITLLSAILTGGGFLIYIYETAMSTSIEIALMKRNGQYKYKLSMFFVLWIAISMMYIGIGMTMVSVEDVIFRQNDIRESQLAEGELIEEELGKTTDEPFEKQELENKQKGGELRNVNGLLIVVGSLLLIFFLIALLAMYGVGKIRLICKLSPCVKVCNLIKRKVKKPLVVNKILLIVCSMIAIAIFEFCGWRWFAVTCFIGGLICRVYASCLVDSKLDSDLRMGLFTNLYLLGIGISNLFGWTKNFSESEMVFVTRCILSVALAFVVAYFSLLILKTVKTSDAQVMYYDEDKKKRIYIYYRYNDDFFVTGEASSISECETYYLLKLESVMGTRLERTSSVKTGFEKAYMENIILEAGNSYVLADVIEKVASELQQKGVNPTEYSETKLYIKPEDKKVYLVVPSDKVPGNEMYCEL